MADSRKRPVLGPAANRRRRIGYATHTPAPGPQHHHHVDRDAVPHLMNAVHVPVRSRRETVKVCEYVALGVVHLPHVDQGDTKVGAALLQDVVGFRDQEVDLVTSLAGAAEFTPRGRRVDHRHVENRRRAQHRPTRRCRRTGATAPKVVLPAQAAASPAISGRSRTPHSNERAGSSTSPTRWRPAAPGPIRYDAPKVRTEPVTRPPLTTRCSEPERFADHAARDQNAIRRQPLYAFHHRTQHRIVEEVQREHR